LLGTARSRGFEWNGATRSKSAHPIPAHKHNGRRTKHGHIQALAHQKSPPQCIHQAMPAYPASA